MTPYPTRPQSQNLIDVAIEQYGARKVAWRAIVQLLTPKPKQVAAHQLSDHIKRDIGLPVDPPPKHPTEYLR